MSLNEPITIIGGEPTAATAISQMLSNRLKKEMAMLQKDPSPGITVWQLDVNNPLELHAHMIGPEETPFSSGLFLLTLSIPPRYPFEPPRARFVTPIYHPNIDSDGRICLDTLKMQPQGSWSPASNINSILLSIRLLLAHPNAEDGLVPDITDLYKRSPEQFNRLARAHTAKHATEAGKRALDCGGKLHEEEEEGQRHKVQKTRNESTIP